MATRRRVDNLINKDIALYLLFLCALSVSSLLVSMMQGTSAMFYAGFPMLLSAGYLVMCIAGCCAQMRRQIQTRIKRRHFNDAMGMYRASMLGALTTGVIMLLFYTLAAQFMASRIFGIRDAYLVLYSMAPAIFCGSFIGNMRGLLEAVGSRHVSRLSMGLLCVLTPLFSLILSMSMAVRGEKVGALLMNPGYKAVYVAAGVGLGISIAMLATFLFLLVTSRFAVHHIREREDHLAIDNDEQMRDLYLYYHRRTIPYAILGMLPVFLIIIDYRFYTGTLQGTVSDYHSEWGGFMGVTLPFVLLLVCAMSILFTADAHRLSQDLTSRNYRHLRVRFSAFMRMSGYILIPVMFYTFGAAKPFVWVFHGGLYGGATDGAVLSLKYMSPFLFLGATAVLTGIFYWESSYQNIVLVSLLFGAAFEIGAMSILSGTGLSMHAAPVALDILAAAYLCCAYYLGKRQILARCDSSWIVDDSRIVLSSLVAAIPVILLNDIMTTSVPALLGVILLLVIYVPIYVGASIMLGCADYEEISRFPGGRYIVMIADNLGKMPES